MLDESSSGTSRMYDEDSFRTSEAPTQTIKQSEPEDEWADGSDTLISIVQAFLGAFSALDWDPFRRCFADDATVFFPLVDRPERAEGREQNRASVQRRVRARSR